MKPIWSICLFATAIVLGTVCIASGQTTADEQAVINFYKDWSAATMKEGPEGYARFFAADGVLLQPDSPPVSGRAAIRDWMQRTLAESKYVTRPEGVNQDDLKVTGERGCRTQHPSRKANSEDGRGSSDIRDKVSGRVATNFRRSMGVRLSNVE